MSLIGDKSTLAFEIFPVTPSWEKRYGPERAAWAGTAIWAGDKNLCGHIMPGSNEVREYFFIPPAPLVDWLVKAYPAIEFEERAPVFATTRDLHRSVELWASTPPSHQFDQDSWLDAREEWWLRHFLRAGADGARVPNLALVRDDEELMVAWAPPRFFGDESPIMLWPEGKFSLPWDHGRSVLEGLASKVAEWLRQSDAGETYPWAHHEEPLRIARPGLSRAIELFTGRQLEMLEKLFGSDKFEDLVKTLHLEETSRDPAASPQCQILRDLSPNLSESIGELLIEVGDLATQERPQALGSWRKARQLAHEAARPANSPEEAGYLAAPEIREVLSLDGQPIGNLTETLEKLGLAYSHVPVESLHDHMMVAVKDGGSAVVKTLETPRTEKHWGQRFEACRALGHVLLDPLRAGAIGAASGPFAEATRRRRSGAFAAELLLPESAIAKASANRLDGAAEEHVFEGLLEQYGIGARAAAYQLWNRRWLSSPSIRDELIDRFGSIDVG